MIRISEIYASIQGETQYAGLPCTLVRTTGCDLRCHYCDSAHAFFGGESMSIDAILEKVRSLGIPLVLLTGGEPMLQPELPDLAKRLLGAGYQVAIETSGAHALTSLPSEVVRIVDVKTPSSGESARMDFSILPTLGPRDALKFVVGDESDYRWSVEWLRGNPRPGSPEILFSPVHGTLNPQDLVAWILRDRMPVRVNLQLHKYVWGPNTRGV